MNKKSELDKELKKKQYFLELIVSSGLQNVSPFVTPNSMQVQKLAIGLQQMLKSG